MIQYVEPDMEIIEFKENDVITSSTKLNNVTNEIPEDSDSAGNLFGW